MKAGDNIISRANLVVRIATLLPGNRYRCTIVQPHRTHHKTLSETDIQNLVIHAGHNSKSARSRS